MCQGKEGKVFLYIVHVQSKLQEKKIETTALDLD